MTLDVIPREPNSRASDRGRPDDDNAPGAVLEHRMSLVHEVSRDRGPDPTVGSGDENTHGKTSKSAESIRFSR
ncbi:MAG: hypothetical protein JWN03_2728 [Nocardia sp.]|uniref:hypothetical protein n=1 Tax=Nocardia sp. TaxID=1821 RepID=UPI0026236BD1|nr:hypothetical protein [Nocardia sp.]MCU1642453.1 hypothetical protein [Nocardia sp.]